MNYNENIMKEILRKQHEGRKRQSGTSLAKDFRGQVRGGLVGRGTAIVHPVAT